MADQHVRIHRNENGGGHVVAIDGHEVQNCTEALSLAMTGRGTSTLRLHLAAVEADVNTRAQVLLDKSTEEALKAMGWTPPESDT
jgi:hypothetical protein